MTGLAGEIGRLALAAQFLTRLPVPAPAHGPDGLARASRYFPLVGAGVGAFGALLYWLMEGSLPPMVAAGLALGAMLWLTGALHEDGLADTADALGGHPPREKALEIMRDSRIGTYGAVALVVVLGLRWAALASMPVADALLALVLAGAAGRAMMAPVTAVVPYAREEGLGQLMAHRPGWLEIGAGGATAFACALLAGAGGLAALAVAALVATVLAWRMAARLGGYTGDTLGAVAAVAETVVLVMMARVAA